MVVGTADSTLDSVKAGVNRLGSVTVEPYHLEQAIVGDRCPWQQACIAAAWVVIVAYHY